MNALMVFVRKGRSIVAGPGSVSPPSNSRWTAGGRARSAFSAVGNATDSATWRLRLDFAEVRPGQRVSLAGTIVVVGWLPCELQEGSGGPCLNVALFATALFASGFYIVREGLALREDRPELLEVIEIAAAHPRQAVQQPDEQRAVIAVEREDQRQRRIPAVVMLGDENVSVEVLGERALEPLVDLPGLFFVAVVEALAERVLIQDEQDARQGVSDEVLVEFSDAIGRDLVAGLEENLQDCVSVELAWLFVYWFCRDDAESPVPPQKGACAAGPGLDSQD